jgi:hypothetical protein
MKPAVGLGGPFLLVQGLHAEIREPGNRIFDQDGIDEFVSGVSGATAAAIKPERKAPRAAHS